MDWADYFAEEEDAREAEVSRRSKRTVTVGWFVNSEKTGVLFSPPKPFSRNDPKAASAKSVQNCPAAVDFDRRHFVIEAPIDVTLHFVRQSNGQLSLKDANGDQSGIRAQGLQDLLVMHPVKEWRHPDRPLIQIFSPYIFLADDPCYIVQTAPYLHYFPQQRPGVQMGGRFPIHIWPRPVSWGFEWHDVTKPLVLKRGEPWFYVRFETENPSARVRLIEQERTEELDKYVTDISDVSKYVNRTFSLFHEARRRRPTTLLRAKKK
ncbi:MAG: hypothetical protein AAFW81_07375 [Pseudomonadota bacterium]